MSRQRTAGALADTSEEVGTGVADAGLVAAAPGWETGPVSRYLELVRTTIGCCQLPPAVLAVVVVDLAAL
jgi:hypothetical protein